MCSELRLNTNTIQKFVFGAFTLCFLERPWKAILLFKNVLLAWSWYSKIKLHYISWLAQLKRTSSRATKNGHHRQFWGTLSSELLTSITIFSLIKSLCKVSPIPCMIAKNIWVLLLNVVSTKWGGWMKNYWWWNYEIEGREKGNSKTGTSKKPGWAGRKMRKTKKVGKLVERGKAGETRS